MPSNFYTFLFIPQSGGPVKKIGLPSPLIWGISICLALIFMAVTYVFYDYIHILREKAELAYLRQETQKQRLQLEGLASRIAGFSAKMEELREFDKKIRIMANLENRRNSAQLLGIGGPIADENRMKMQLGADEKTLMASVHQNVDQLAKEAAGQERRFQELLYFLKKQNSLLAVTPSIWPVTGWVTSEFGARVSPFTGTRELHGGIDIATRMGSPVKAPADGMISEAAYQSGMGNCVRIEHGNGMSTWYGHLSGIAVRPGSLIRRGDILGYVGSSGRSTGSHLHYSVFLDGVVVNPRKYLN